MDMNIQKSPELDYHIDDVGDEKYVSDLSTILVTRIQEAKDQISQIEYIFCKQLFPNFQSRSKTMQKILSDAKKAAEVAWENKKRYLMLQIERLNLEIKGIEEENCSLKLENAKLVSDGRPLRQINDTKLKKLEEGNEMVCRKQRVLQLEAQEIRGELAQKSKQVDEGMELQNIFIQMVQSKANLIQQKEKELTEQEEKKNELLVQIEHLENNAGTIQEQLREKSNELTKEQTLHEKLLRENNSYVLKNLNNQQLLDKCEKEKKLLMGKVESLKRSVNELQRKLMINNEEVEEGRKLQEQYLEQIDRNSKELLKTTMQVEKLERENKSFVVEQKGLQNKVDKLGHKNRVDETSEELELHGKLLQKIQEKDSEIQSEKKKRKELVAGYKQLKSQYNFLRGKFGLTTECLDRSNEMKDESNSSRLGQNPSTSPDKGMMPLLRGPSCEIPSTSKYPSASMEPKNTRSGILAGTKRPASSWRDTRSHQGEGRGDPHDNFLDTPLENIMGNIRKSSKAVEVHDIPDRAPRDISFKTSDDDETQDLAADLASKKPAPGSGGKSDFKFIAPVRKKAERENLKGIECKQCRKFYDAVLPENGDKSAELRCEHHDGVSRHRYRFAPPSTPEGFWNIGLNLKCN